MQSCLTSGSLSKFSLLIIYCTLNALGFASKCPTLHCHQPTKPFHLLHRESLLVYVNLISSTLISFDEQLQNDRNSSPFTFGALRTAWDSISNKHLTGYSLYPDAFTRQEMRVQGNNASPHLQVGQELQSRTLSSPATQSHVHLTCTTTPTPQTNRAVNLETASVTQTHQVTPITRTTETDPLNVLQMEVDQSTPPTQTNQSTIPTQTRQSTLSTHSGQTDLLNVQQMETEQPIPTTQTQQSALIGHPGLADLLNVQQMETDQSMPSIQHIQTDPLNAQPMETDQSIPPNHSNQTVPMNSQLMETDQLPQTTQLSLLTQLIAQLLVASNPNPLFTLPPSPPTPSTMNAQSHGVSTTIPGAPSLPPLPTPSTTIVQSHGVSTTIPGAPSLPPPPTPSTMVVQSHGASTTVPSSPLLLLPPAHSTLSAQSPPNSVHPSSSEAPSTGLLAPSSPTSATALTLSSHSPSLQQIAPAGNSTLPSPQMAVTSEWILVVLEEHNSYTCSTLLTEFRALLSLILGPPPHENSPLLTEDRIMEIIQPCLPAPSSSQSKIFSCTGNH